MHRTRLEVLPWYLCCSVVSLWGDWKNQVVRTSIDEGLDLNTNTMYSAMAVSNTLSKWKLSNWNWSRISSAKHWSGSRLTVVEKGMLLAGVVRSVIRRRGKECEVLGWVICHSGERVRYRAWIRRSTRHQAQCQCQCLARQKAEVSNPTVWLSLGMRIKNTWVCLGGEWSMWRD